MAKHEAIPSVTPITSKTLLERRTGISESDMAEPVEGEPFIWLGRTWDDSETYSDALGTGLAAEWRKGLRGSEL